MWGELFECVYVNVNGESGKKYIHLIAFFLKGSN